MQQFFVTGNQFQRHMLAQFNQDIDLASAHMANVRGRENYVYDYIKDIFSLFQPVNYRRLENPSGLYADYDSFKEHFVKYWKNALDISKADLDEIRDIFDEELSTQESCKNRPITSVFFENGKALTIKDCLNAVYEVLKTV